MRAWLSDRFSEHPWLITAVALYLALSAIEMTRIVLVADPTDQHDEGFSAWQEVPAPGGGEAKLVFRWSEPRSILYRPVEAAVLGVTAYRPEGSRGEVDVSFALDGKPLDAYTASVAGTYTFYYYLPPILAQEKWTEIQAHWRRQAREEAQRAAGGWFANWQELKPWSPPPQPPAIEIRTTLESVADANASEVGVASLEGGAGASVGDAAVNAPSSTTGPPLIGIATIEWRDELPDDGTGFHGAETDANGTPFRWTRRWASLPLEATSSEAIVRIRAIHPDIGSDPVDVTLFWNDEQRASVALTSTDWTDVAVPLDEPGSEGVLTIHVERTWSPARAGISADRRELGVAFATITWR